MLNNLWKKHSLKFDIFFKWRDYFRSQDQASAIWAEIKKSNKSVQEFQKIQQAIDTDLMRDILQIQGVMGKAKGRSDDYMDRGNDLIDLIEAIDIIRKT